MSKLLAVDPGIRGCGVAFFIDGVLVRALYAKNSMTTGNGPIECARMAAVIQDLYLNEGRLDYLSDIALEWPQVYTSSKGDPNDLLALAGVGSAITCLLPGEVRYFLPRQWKGQMTKEVCHARIKERLSQEEIRAIESAPRGLLHNTLDAIGVGLHALNRLAPRRATIL